MRKLVMLTAGAVMLTASAAFAQSSIDAPNGGREPGRDTGHATGHATGDATGDATGHALRQTRTGPHAASTRVSSRRKQSDESCSQAPTTGHEPGAPAPARAAASPPVNGAIDRSASPATRCPPPHRS